MTRHCHETSYVLADPFINMLVFFMSDAMTAVNPFLDPMPRELHEQYMADCLTEFMELAETNKTKDDSVISVKYGLIVL